MKKTTIVGFICYVSAIFFGFLVLYGVFGSSNGIRVNMSILFTFILILAGTCSLIPEWRESFPNMFKSLINRFKGQKEEEDWKSPSTVENPSEGEIEDDYSVKELAKNQDPEILWKIARKEMEKGEIKVAREILDGALEQHEDFTKLYVTSGYNWWCLEGYDENIPEAISDTEKALKKFEEEGEEGSEQYYLACSNLTYFLANKDRDHQKEKALELGEEAAEHVDEFENRDSFVINYGYARITFSESFDEMINALKYLVDLHQRDLAKEEREEINDYIREGLEEIHTLA